MTRLFISIGSNVDREEMFHKAYDALQRSFSAVTPSSVYESAPVGFSGDDFFNAVISCNTDAPLEEVLAILDAIEASLGRERNGERYGPRNIDLDLLTFGDAVVDRPGVHLPRAEILKYAFVLRPLSELAPDELHPVTRRTYREIWSAFNDATQILSPVEFSWANSDVRSNVNVR